MTFPLVLMSFLSNEVICILVFFCDLIVIFMPFSVFSNAQNWLRMDKRVIDHELPRYQEPLILTFSVR